MGIGKAGLIRALTSFFIFQTLIRQDFLLASTKITPLILDYPRFSTGINKTTTCRQSGTVLFFYKWQHRLLRAQKEKEQYIQKGFHIAPTYIQRGLAPVPPTLHMWGESPHTQEGSPQKMKKRPHT